MCVVFQRVTHNPQMRGRLSQPVNWSQSVTFALVNLLLPPLLPADRLRADGIVWGGRAYSCTALLSLKLDPLLENTLPTLYFPLPHFILQFFTWIYGLWLHNNDAWSVYRKWDCVFLQRKPPRQVVLMFSSMICLINISYVDTSYRSPMVHTPLLTFTPSYPTVDTYVHLDQNLMKIPHCTVRPLTCPDLSFFGDKHMTHTLFEVSSSALRSLFVQGDHGMGLWMGCYFLSKQLKPEGFFYSFFG